MPRYDMRLSLPLLKRVYGPGSVFQVSDAVNGFMGEPFCVFQLHSSTRPVSLGTIVG